MKTSLFILAMLSAGLLLAQTAGPGGNFETRLPRETRTNLWQRQPPTLNRILGARFIYTGIAIELARADNPIQLLNPLALERYGDAEQNVSRDLITGRITGLKLFSVSF
jgi:hypothetical protein